MPLPHSVHIPCCRTASDEHHGAGSALEERASAPHHDGGVRARDDGDCIDIETAAQYHTTRALVAPKHEL